MVVPELHLVQVEGKLLRGDTMVLEQLPLGIAPEAFQSVDMDLAPTEPLLMIDREAAVAAKRERIIAPKLIGVHQGSPLDDLDRFLQERLGRDVGHHGHRHAAAPLQNAKDRDFASGAPPSEALPAPAEVRLVGLDLAP